MSTFGPSGGQPHASTNYSGATTRTRDELLAEIEDRFSCDHPNEAYRTKTASNGTVHYRRQCLRCGHGTVIKKADLTGKAFTWDLTPFDDDLQNEWWRRRSEAIQDVYERLRGEHSRQWWADYNAYLATPAWRERRQKVLDRAAGLCEGCRANRADVVHHLTYERVGREMLFDLVAVCQPCHEQIHPHMDRHEVTTL